MVNKLPVANKIEEKKVKKNNKEYKEYKVRGDKRTDGDNSIEVYVVFDGDVDYVVDKLKVKNSGLETTFNKKNVDWYNFFQVKKKDGAFLNGVTYSVYFSSDATEIVYFDGENYGNKATSDGNWNDTDMKVVTFDKGDPAIGITN